MMLILLPNMSDLGKVCFFGLQSKDYVYFQLRLNYVANIPSRRGQSPVSSKGCDARRHPR
jgi:hypothetical protein